LAQVDVGRAVPGEVLVGSDVVVLGAVGMEVAGELEGVGDLFEEEPLVLQRSEAAFA